jgi:hypothetical protein
VSYDRLPEIRKGGRLVAYAMINFRVMCQHFSGQKMSLVFKVCS